MAITKGPKPKTDRNKKAKKDEDIDIGSEKERAGRECSSGAIEKDKGTSEDAGTDLCGDCGKYVSATQQGLQCDGCGFWHHCTCEKVQEDIFSFLRGHDGEPSLLWYCKKCVVSCKKMTSMLMAMQQHHQHLEEKVTELANTVQGLNENLTKKDNKLSTAGEESQKRVEEKFDVLIHTVQNNIDLQNSMGDVVTSKMKEDQEEIEEIRRRRTSVIIHGLKESTEEDLERRKKDDENLIVDLLHDMKCDDISVSSSFRLGRRPDDTSVNARPVKLSVASEEQKAKVLRQAKNLKGLRVWEKVFMHQDLTPKQRTKRHQLVQEKKRREEDGEINLIIVNNKIVTKRATRMQ